MQFLVLSLRGSFAHARGVLYEPTGPTMGHLQLFRKAPGEGIGTLAIERVIGLRQEIDN